MGGPACSAASSRRVRLLGAVVCFLGGVAVLAAEPLPFAQRRAALEITAGRPQAAVTVLAALAPRPTGERWEQEATLLWAEATLLAGDTQTSEQLCRELLSAPTGFVRAQAAAHLLGLHSHANDSTAARAAMFFLAQASAYSKQEAAAAAEGFLLAAAILERTGQAKAADTALERTPGAAAAVARLLRGEMALRRDEPEAAESHFRALRTTGGDSLARWVSAAAGLGQARALVARGDAKRAREILAALQASPLGGYARLLEAQVADAEGDLEGAANLLAGLALESRDAVHAVEATLLAAQIELDRGRFARAESLATSLRQRLPALLDPSAAASLPGALCFDLPAWHASRTRATLAELAEREVLRHPPHLTALDAVSPVMGFARALAADTLHTSVTLLDLERFAPAEATEPPWRDAARELCAARAQVERTSQLAATARTALDVRQELLARAGTALASERQALDALAAATTALEAALADYRAALARQEDAWLAMLQARLDALRSAAATLSRATTTLKARYPHDRSVRDNEESARARASLQGAQAFQADVERLHAEILPQVEARVRAVLREREPAAAALALAALRARVAALQNAIALLAAKLDAADAAERGALAAAEAAWRDADRLNQDARAAESSTRTALAADLATTREARRLAYDEAAHDAEAMAAFLAAVEDTASTEELRLQRFEHAVLLLESFVQCSPQPERAAEALYRLGEVHVRRAALAHQRALAEWLAAGHSTDNAPLPVEQYADALDAFSRLLAAHTSSPRALDARFQMGFLFAEIGSPSVASEHLVAFLAAVPPTDVRHGKAALRLGENHTRLGDLAAALDAYALAAEAPEVEIRALAQLRLGWCAYELERYETSRTALRTLLAETAPAATDLHAEALELLSLCFAADHTSHEAAGTLDAWSRPFYDFVVLRRMAQLFAGRAQYDEAIETWQTLLERHPLHPHAPGAAVELLRLVALRHGEPAAHALAPELMARFAPGGAWAEHAAQGTDSVEVGPAWQSRLVEEDREATRADSLARSLALPAAAAARAAQHVRGAAVYAHRQARAGGADATHRRDLAVELYRKTLALFPGGEDESTTWLYLGEALYEAERPLDAADAYAAAASHASADSTTRERAAAAELAALDRAAAADAAVLERFDTTTRRYLEAHPGDGRALDALERVGALAFAAGRDEQAAAAYADLAARTPDPGRAALASKIVGDTWWRREDYVRAADAYATALERSRTSGSDSLATVLIVLVPGALFRAASGAEERGASGDAAQLFERVAAEHGQFDSADQALYRAARLRTSMADTTSALTNYARLVETMPQSSLHPDALLELAGLRAARGDKAAAAATYQRFAVTHAEHGQAGAARLHAAELFTAAGDTVNADAEYAKLLSSLTSAARPETLLVADLHLRRARLARSSPRAAGHYAQALAWSSGLGAAERAEANFYLAEAKRAAYEAIKLEGALGEALARKKAALEEVLAAYATTLNEPVEPWHAAACLRVGECLVHLGESLLASSPPAELGAGDLEAYRGALRSQAQALENRAVEMWSRGLRSARTHDVGTPWSPALVSRLYPVLAHSVPLRPEPLFVVVQP